MENSDNLDWAAVTAQLRLIADSYLGRERTGHTLQATALVHEAWLRLWQRDDATLRSPVDFARMAARTMRRVLIDHARARAADKRARRVDPDTDVDELPSTVGDVDRLLDFDAKLCELDRIAPDLAQLVRLERYGGLDLAQIAGLLGKSERTVRRDRKAAMAWLRTALSGEEDLAAAGGPA